MDSELKKLKLSLMQNGINVLPEDLTMAITNRVTSCNGIFVRLKLDEQEINVKTKINPLSEFSVYDNDGILTLVDSSGTFLVDSLNFYRNPVNKIFSPQLNDVLAVSLWGCELVNIKRQCYFCASKAYQGPNFSVEEFGNELRRIRSSQVFDSITVNAGSMISRSDRGYGLMSPYVQAAVAEGFKRVNLELMPPSFSGVSLENFLKGAKCDGVTSVQFNIEIYGARRTELMPYKGMIPLEKYFDAIKIGSEIFGLGKVSSVLLAGLNDINELEEGSCKIFEFGGVPSIEIFRPLEGTRLEEFKPSIDYDGIIKLNKNIMNELKQKFVGNYDDVNDCFEGCLRCGGCNLLQDK